MEKYVFHSDKLKSFLHRLNEDYKLLSVNHKLIAPYENIYFDTPELKSYHDHHNQRSSRYKIRFRRYSDSDKCFEIKRKDNRGFTSKERLAIDSLSSHLTGKHMNF